ncbi:hypothetical protein GF389_06015 [Candidatus Dojkabacteria bacterium]|nr:hypothetical protein [Candidatus Dojkabacteria bacterium]
MYIQIPEFVALLEGRAGERVNKDCGFLYSAKDYFEQDWGIWNSIEEEPSRGGVADLTKIDKIKEIGRCWPELPDDSGGSYELLRQKGYELINTRSKADVYYRVFLLDYLLHLSSSRTVERDLLENLFTITTPQDTLTLDSFKSSTAVDVAAEKLQGFVDASKATGTNTNAYGITGVRKATKGWEVFAPGEFANAYSRLTKNHPELVARLAGLSSIFNLSSEASAPEVVIDQNYIKYQEDLYNSILEDRQSREVYELSNGFNRKILGTLVKLKKKKSHDENKPQFENYEFVLKQRRRPMLVAFTYFRDLLTSVELPVNGDSTKEEAKLNLQYALTYSFYQNWLDILTGQGSDGKDARNFRAMMSGVRKDLEKYCQETVWVDKELAQYVSTLIEDLDHVDKTITQHNDALKQVKGILPQINSSGIYHAPFDLRNLK